MQQTAGIDMSSPRPLEEDILAPAVRTLDKLAGYSTRARMEILEGASSRLGGFSLNEYRKRFNSPLELTSAQTLDCADVLLSELRDCEIPIPLALSALARPRLTPSKQRSSGVYYTDFRLAQHIAAMAAEYLVPGAKVVDPAAGSGILLVAATLAACGDDRLRRSKWLAESVTAADLAPEALRGARLALASLTDDLAAIREMTSRWLCQDSLVLNRFEPHWFDVVLGNPPWNKVKLTRHEFLKAKGGLRHYGDEYAPLDSGQYSAELNDIARYGLFLTERYQLLGSGEPDLYKAFLELFLTLVRPGGRISVLLPAGLIRSQGTEHLRRFLFQNAAHLSITIMENRARFFAIDTRFKFVGLALTRAMEGNLRGHDVHVLHARGTKSGVAEAGNARIRRNVLAVIRPDLTIPEVRSEREWRLFKAMSENALPKPGEKSPWHAKFIREVDMTRDRKHFKRCEIDRDDLPLIEGRMIHQHRFGAKAYRYGTGRKARWDTIELGNRELAPQFWYPRKHLPPSSGVRAHMIRAGFCDITGQTNERSMLAALIPAQTVCGNKVPTVTFPNDPSDSRLFLWIAIVNSIPFDWALRRLVTTTVNYFLLRSVPFPGLEPDSLPGRRLVQAARDLHAMDAGWSKADARVVAELRAVIDIGVLSAYGLEFGDLELMLQDFPLLDRGQPPLRGEDRSTITRDFLLSHAAIHFDNQACEYEIRVSRAHAVGAVPYVPSEFTSVKYAEAQEAGGG